MKVEAADISCKRIVLVPYSEIRKEIESTTFSKINIVTEGSSKSSSEENEVSAQNSILVFAAGGFISAGGFCLILLREAKMAENTRTKTKISAAKIVRRVPDIFMTVLSVLLMGGMAFVR